MAPEPAGAPPAAPIGVSVVIPCLNEEQAIVAVIERAKAGIRAAGLPGEVVVVDNGSTDASAELARGAGARVVAEPTPGYGAALRRGFDEARYEYMVMADGDMTYDLAGLPVFVETLARGEADLVVGNRWGDMRAGAMPALHRYLGNPILSFLLRVMFRPQSVRDMHCGMRAIRRSRWLELGCVTDGMEFASEMIVRAARLGLPMKEVPISYSPRLGDSKLASFQDGWRHLRFMALHSPTWVLLLPGGVLWVLSVLLLAGIALSEVRLFGRIVSIHTLLLGGLLNVTSLQFLTIGVLSRAFAHLVGMRRDAAIERFLARFTFERLALATLPLVAAGLYLTLRVIVGWVESDFGALDAARPLFFGILLLINGTQVWASGYLLSAMIFMAPRHAGSGAARRAGGASGPGRSS